MAVDHTGARDAAKDAVRRQDRDVRRAGKQTSQNASISRADFTVRDGGRIIIQNGGLYIDGEGRVTGTLTVTGSLEGSGDIDWTGPSIFRGTVNVAGNSAFGGTLDITGSTEISGDLVISGDLDVTGETTLNADVTLNDDLVIGSGRIVAGPLVIDKLGPQAGRIAASSVLVLDAGNAIALRANTVVSGVLVADGLDVDGPKNFRMAHPTKPGFWLRHGSTESPVSGTEYTGCVKLGADGSAVVKLPAYFEGLNKPEGRTVQLTPVGRPFAVGADDVVNGKFTVYGTAGREVYWLVKAERFGGEFLLEEEVPDPQDDEAKE